MEGVTMGIARMDHFISIGKMTNTTDSEGFNSATFETLREVRAFREGKHGSERWANLAAFSEATDQYKIRVIPDFTVTTDMIIIEDNHTFEITSVEDVKGRGMYLEILVKEVKPSG